MLVDADPRFPLGRRGERPLRLSMSKESGRRVSTLIPGALWVKGQLTLSWEMLPAAATAAGLDTSAVELLPPQLDLPGMEDYRRLFGAKLRGYQKQMLQFLVLRSYAINADPMRCLSGKSRLIVRWASGGRETISLGELWQRQQVRPREFFVRSAHEDGGQLKFVWNKCTLMHATGMRRCLRATFTGSQGCMLIATPEHKVWTRSGMRQLQTLHRGDEVLCMGSSQQTQWRSLETLEEADGGLVSTYDLTMANPLNNYLAEGVVVSNSGKTPTTLAAACILDVKKCLIVCPSIAKLVWATELVKWMQLPSLILYGRSADEAHGFCVPCNGTGRDSTGAHCPHCKRKNGQSYGTVLYEGREAVLGALDSYRFVIANFDILTPQMKLSAAGVRQERDDLPGWHNVLTGRGFDLVIVDEAHILRGRSKGNRIGESRRDKLVKIARGVQRLWALTGTPIYGRVADMWAMLDVITDGLFGRPGWDFDKQYAGGHKGEYGWENNGMTNPDQLKSRLDAFLLKRDRKEILPELPAKTRQIIRIDAGKVSFKRPKGERSTGGLHGALRTTANVKEETVVENVSNECAEGAKVVVFTYLRDNAQSLYKAFEKAKEGDPRLKLRNLRVWCVSGDVSTDARFKQAQAFREWEGSAIFVATIDSVPVAISLKGAQSVHFADLTFDPASLLQAEDRPYEVGTNGLAIVYYVVEKTVDEHVIELVLPKMEMLESILQETAASDFSAAFGSKLTPEQMAEEIWQRMEAAAL